MQEDIFSEPLSAALTKFHETPTDSDMFYDMIKKCLDATVKVLERRYTRYLSLNITEKLKEETK